MEIKVNDENKTVEVWLGSDEKNNPTVQAKLKPLYSEYKARKYTVAVFQSGNSDLYNSMRDLLKYNKRRAAELSAMREKSRKTASMER